MVPQSEAAHCLGKATGSHKSGLRMNIMKENVPNAFILLDIAKGVMQNDGSYISYRKE